jgi:hypothetical protein
MAVKADPLLTEVGGLLQRAAAIVAPEGRASLEDAQRRVVEPLRVAIAGRVKAGKSTLLNALVGEELAPTDASECTRIVTWYRHGLTYEALAHLKSGNVASLPLERADHAVMVELGDVEADDVTHLEVRWPSGRLEPMTLIDTPGVESLSTDVSARAEAFLDPEDDEVSGADALLYLMQHTHQGDVRLLEAFNDPDLGRGTPVNAVGVLSRADEIGGCRLDALAVATRAADRYLDAPELRRVCLTVVPVAGLTAQAAATLAEHEFQALATLAKLPAAELGALLMTADRFTAEVPAREVSVETRRDLLDRLGFYGVRVAIDAIRSGRAPTSGTLASELMARSGLPMLQSLLATHFAGRSRVLKARTALLVLERALRDRADEPEAQAVLREAERLRTSDHEFTEIRVLNALRSGQLSMSDEQLAELERTLGGAGDAATVRLGIHPEATDAEILAAAGDQLARWRRLADHPLTSRATVDAALAAVRTCEGILANGAARAGAPEPAPEEQPAPPSPADQSPAPAPADQPPDAPADTPPSPVSEDQGESRSSSSGSGET